MNQPRLSALVAATLALALPLTGFAAKAEKPAKKKPGKDPAAAFAE